MTEAIATSLSKVVEEIGDEIKSGSIANYLNKPYNYIAYKYSSAIGIAMYKFMFIFLFGGIVAYITVGGFAFSWTALIPVAICAFLAITLDFVIMATLGIFAFWFEDARALSFLYQKFLFTIGGMLIPLEFFPDWLAYVSKFLPFSYISYAPAKLFVSYSFTAFINTALFQIMWIFIFLILSYVLYRFCEKRLSVNGG
jgi:ABC-2 type transport system permease protein